MAWYPALSAAMAHSRSPIVEREASYADWMVPRWLFAGSSSRPKMSIRVLGEAIDLRIPSLLASSPESLPVDALAIRNAIFLIISRSSKQGTSY